MALLRRSICLTVGAVAAVSVLAFGSSQGWDKMFQLEQQLDQLEPPENPPRNRPLGELLVAGSVSSDEMAMLAQFFDAPVYWLLPAGLTVVGAEPGTVLVIGVGQLADGTDLFFGDTVQVGTSVAWGLLGNMGSRPLLIALKGAPDAEPVHIAPGGMVAVGNFINDFEASAFGTTSCSVRCGPAYYSCCCCVLGQANCLCIAVGEQPGAPCVSCDAGGVGSTGCSITCIITD